MELPVSKFKTQEERIDYLLNQMRWDALCKLACTAMIRKVSLRDHAASILYPS